jgi:hypothetical protein
MGGAVMFSYSDLVLSGHLWSLSHLVIVPRLGVHLGKFEASLICHLVGVGWR